jgi:hypothetical protein
MPDPEWTARGTRDSLRAVRPLIDAHARKRSVAVEEIAASDFVEFRAHGISGRVPVDPRLRRFAQAAAAVCCRNGLTGPVALLAQWDERSHQLAEDASRLAPAALFWSARIITGRDLPEALGIGLGACLYFGHGHCGGWDGYWGIDAPKLAAAMVEPVGTVFSLTCRAAQRPPHGLSFCEELVLSGYCAAAYGSAGRTSHPRNARLGIALCRAMQHHADAASILANSGASWLSMAGYRLIGDPLASLAGHPAARPRAEAIESRFFLAAP